MRCDERSPHGLQVKVIWYAGSSSRRLRFCSAFSASRAALESWSVRGLLLLLLEEEEEELEFWRMVEEGRRSGRLYLARGEEASEGQVERCVSCERDREVEREMAVRGREGWAARRPWKSERAGRMI